MRKLAPIFISLLVLSLVIGCGGGTQSKPTLTSVLTSEQIMANVVTAVDNQDTAKVDLHVTNQRHVVDSDIEREEKFWIDGTGCSDLANKQVQWTGCTSFDLPNECVIDLSIYGVQGIVYQRAKIHGQPEEWIKMEPTDEEYLNFYYTWGMLPWQMNLLKTSSVEVLRNEILEGIDCYVLEVKPDLNQIWDLVSQRNFFLAAGATSIGRPTTMSDVIKDVSITEWVCKDTFLPVRFDISLRVLLSSQYLEFFPFTEGYVDSQLQFIYSDYGEPVLITLPSEAQGAEEKTWSYWEYGVS